MLPPPAPTVTMSTAGARIGLPPISWRAVTGGTPSGIRHTSSEVPPMSSETSWPSPYRAPRATAPATPAAGPDSTSRWAWSAARSAGRQPPLDCMICTAGAMPSAPISDRSRSR